MKISALFCREHVISELRGTTALEVIDELMTHLVTLGKIAPSLKEPAATALKKREKTMSTGIGFGIAIPHAYSDLFHEPIIMFGRSSIGIDFSALDSQPVKIVMLVISPEHDRSKHLWIISSGARLFHNKDIRNSIEHATDPETISDILMNGASLLIESQKRLEESSTSKQFLGLNVPKR